MLFLSGYIYNKSYRKKRYFSHVKHIIKFTENALLYQVTHIINDTETAISLMLHI